MDTKAEVLENLSHVDDYINIMFPGLKRLELIVIGGASFLLKGLSNDYTLDIDTISQIDEQVMMFLNDFSINDAALEVLQIPLSYRERLEKLDVKFNILEVYNLSNEDLIITKLGRSDIKDLTTIKHSGILNRVNTSLLMNLGDEMCNQDSKFKRKWEYFKKVVFQEEFNV